MRADGSYVGRASPEIDVFEAIVDDNVGMVLDYNFYARDPIDAH